MARIYLNDNDEVCLDGPPTDATLCAPGRHVRDLLTAPQNRGKDIVFIDGMSHNVEATKRALKLFDRARELLKGWPL